MIARIIFGNQSTLAILLASLLLFAISILKQRWKKSGTASRIFILAALLSIGYFIVASCGRAGWIGFAVGGAYFLHRTTAFRLSLKTVCIGLLLACPVLACLIWIKLNSSLGRLLIYKISAKMFHDHWITGIGFGNFKTQYNLYQAGYFSKNDIDCEEALLADNSFYAFNDCWQLLIEIGTIRFLGLLLLSLLIFKTLLQCNVKKEKGFLFNGALSGLLCIVVASLFSNPFQFFGLQLISIVFLLAIFFSISLPGSVFRHLLWILSSLKMAAFAVLVLLGFYNYEKVRVISNSKKAFDLYQAGFKGEALYRYSILQHSSFKYGPLLLQYAKSLYNSNRLQEAKNMISETKKYYSDNEVYKLSAAIEFERGDMAQAEEDFKTALYMVPNRMKTRFELFRFYLDTRDTVQALFWGNSILNMPVKIPSATIEDLKEKTRSLLKKIQYPSSTENTLHPFY
jgi:hypothetical protein